MPNFVSVTAHVAELAHGEKSHNQSLNQSLTHSPSLFDAPGTIASEFTFTVLYNDKKSVNGLITLL